MFSTNIDYSGMKASEILIEVMHELDEIKRYVANTYANTDNEVSEILTLVKKIDSKVRETDSQIDRIERFDRELNEIKSSLKQIVRKM